MTKSSGNIPTGRTQSVRVKTAKRRTVSSARWLERQLNDPYVVEAKKRGLRSRAAFKLLQLDEKFGLLKRGQRIVDLGAAPGGWTQVAVEKSKSDKGGTGLVIGLDLLEMDPVPGATTFQMDFTTDEAPAKLKSLLNGPADIVMSDMAANTTGHTQTDHLRITGLAEMAYQFATEVLAPGGHFICKLFQGGAEKDLLAQMKKDFTSVRHAKPAASRQDSSETYLVAMGFRGGVAAQPADDGQD